MVAAVSTEMPSLPEAFEIVIFTVVAGACLCLWQGASIFPQPLDHDVTSNSGTILVDQGDVRETVRMVFKNQTPNTQYCQPRSITSIAKHDDTNVIVNRPTSTFKQSIAFLVLN